MLFAYVFGQGIANSADVTGGNNWSWRAKHGILRLLWRGGCRVEPDSPVARALAGLTNNGQPCPTPACLPVTDNGQSPTPTSSAPAVGQMWAPLTASSTEGTPAATPTATVIQLPWLPEALRWPGANDLKGHTICLAIGGAVFALSILARLFRRAKKPADKLEVTLRFVQPMDSV
ncbi:hypothetical protein FBU31_001224 [Coemansia sp. 'formosensis']|nr:hypothetical protein FBU31_001224 [Coemansia sp. 'formosensis']